MFIYFGYYLLINYTSSNIFFPFSRLSISFVNGFFFNLKTFGLIRSHLFIFALVSFVLGDRAKKNMATIYVKSVLPKIFSRNFLIFSLTFDQ